MEWESIRPIRDMSIFEEDSWFIFHDDSVNYPDEIQSCEICKERAVKFGIDSYKQLKQKQNET